MGSITSSSAQTKTKTTTKATKKALTAADANTIIIYSNSVNTFLTDYLNTSVMSDFYKNVSIGLEERGRKVRTTLYDQFRYGNNGMDFKEKVAYFINAQGANNVINPGNPPSIIGSDNVTFMKSKWTELETAYASVLINHNKVLEYLDSELELRNPSNEKALLADLDIYKQSVVKVYAIASEMYDRTDVLGDMAEEVTLAKHPLKAEIIDIRKILRMSSKYQKVLNGIDTPNEAKNNIASFEAFRSALSEYINKYADYNADQGATPQVKSIKANMVNFIKSTKRLDSDLNKYYLQVSDEDTLNLVKRAFNSDLENMGSNFESLINTNNNY